MSELLEIASRELTAGGKVLKETRKQIAGKGPEASEDELRAIVLWYAPQVQWNDKAVNRDTGIHLTRVRRYIKQHQKALAKSTEGAEEKIREEVEIAKRTFNGRMEMIDILDQTAHEALRIVLGKLQITDPKEINMSDLAKIGGLLGISIDKRLILANQETKKLAESDHRFADEEELKKRAARNEAVLEATELKIVEGGAR